MTNALVVEAAGDLRGSERALLDLLDGTRALTVAVCCPPARPLNAELAKRGIRLLPYYVYELHRKSKWQRALAALGVLRACFEFKPDVIYLNQSGAYKVALPAATLFNVPIVAHVRLFADAAYLARQKPDRRRLRGVIAVSSAVLDEIRRFREFDAIPSHLIYDGYAGMADDSSTAPSERNRQCVAFVGRLEPDKGPDILIGALARLRQRGKDVRCVFAGEGEPRFVDTLKTAATNGGVSAAVQWLGFVPDVPRLLRTCAALACPSHRETLGRVILEAWNAGAVPIVFSGSGGAAEIVAASRGGILYHEQTLEALADALLDVLALEPQRAAELITNGRAWVARNCDQKTCSAAVVKILSDACRQN